MHLLTWTVILQGEGQAEVVLQLATNGQQRHAEVEYLEAAMYYLQQVKCDLLQQSEAEISEQVMTLHQMA